jgi:ketosteroid isomerase-like protein
MHRRLLATTVVVAFAGCAREAQEPAIDYAADVAAIVALNETILGHMNSGDWQALNQIVAEDYVALVPGSAPIVGRAANQAANRRFLERWDDEERWIPVETVIDGDLAVQRGTFTMTLTPKEGGEGRTSGGNYLHVYQRQADGSWALTRAMAGSAEFE